MPEGEAAAQDALQRAANAQEPNNNAKAQKDAADALKELRTSSQTKLRRTTRRRMHGGRGATR